MGLISDAGRNPGDIMLRMAALERAVDEIRTARRLESAGVGSGGIRVHSGGSVRLQGGGSVQVEGGGSVQVEDGGNIVVSGGMVEVRDAEGRPRLRISAAGGGGQVATAYAAGVTHMLAGTITSGGENVGQGFLVQQESGQDIFNAFPSPVTRKVQFRVWDHEGTPQFRTDADGVGLDRPYLDVPMYLQNSSGSTGYPGSDWQALWSGRLWATHPAVHAHVLTWVSEGAGQIRVTVNGTQIGSTRTVSNTSREFWDFGNHGITDLVNPYNFTRINIEGRITSGSGQINVIPYGVTKRGSS